MNLKNRKVGVLKMKCVKISIILSSFILFMLMVMSCSNQEDQSFTQSKLDLRQRIDEMILEIDEELEDLNERIASDDTTQIIETKNDINNLKVRRAELDQVLEEIKNISKKEWDSFKQKTDVKLVNIDSTLREIRFEPAETQVPDLTPY